MLLDLCLLQPGFAMRHEWTDDALAISKKGSSPDGHEPRDVDHPAGETPAAADADEVIRLAAEELHVDKREIETGRVRVSRHTTERTERVSVDLSKESVDVRRVPVGKQVTEMPQVRETEDEIIIPLVEEVVVVERRLVLREELHVRKVRTTEKHTEDVTLRTQSATVDRVTPTSSDGGPPPGRAF